MYFLSLVLLPKVLKIKTHTDLESEKDDYVWGKRILNVIKAMISILTIGFEGQ